MVSVVRYSSDGDNRNRRAVKKRPEAPKGSNELGRLLRSVREAQQIPQKLAALECGITPAYLADLEAGRRAAPTHHLLVSLSDYLGIPLHALAAAAGARVDANIPRSADQIAEYLHRELAQLVEDLDEARNEIANHNAERLRTLVDAARARATTFLIIVRRARGKAQNRTERASARRDQSGRVVARREGNGVPRARQLARARA
jgi:transcriptional regulator with XRE-family HTH domain